MQIELNPDQSLSLKLSPREARLIADALDVVSPDYQGQQRLASDMAFNISTFLTRFNLKGD